GSRRAIRPARTFSYTTLPRPPQPGPRFERLANRPSSSGRAASIYAAIPNFGKVEYFRAKGLTGGGMFCPTGHVAGMERGAIRGSRANRAQRNPPRPRDVGPVSVRRFPFERRSVLRDER